MYLLVPMRQQNAWKQWNKGNADQEWNKSVTSFSFTFSWKISLEIFIRKFILENFDFIYIFHRNFKSKRDYRLW